MAPHSFCRRLLGALGALLLGLVCARSAAASPVLVSGEVSVDSTGTTVNLSSTFANPVVIAFPATRNDAAPAVPRVSSVTPTSFFVRIQETPNLDGVHVAETVSYIVVEQGTHTLSSGRRLIAGFATMTAGTAVNTAFGSSFAAVPLLLANVQTVNDPNFVHVRTNRVRVNDWQARLEQQESATNGHGTESVGYVALGCPATPAVPGCTTLGVFTESGFTFAAVDTGDIVSSTDFTVMLGTTFPSQPAILAVSTSRSDEPCAVRRAAVPGTNDRVVVFMQEDTSADTNTAHPAEVVNVLALLPGVLLSDPPTLAVAAVEGSPSGILRSGAAAEPLFAFSVSSDVNELINAVSIGVDIGGSAAAGSLTSLALYVDVDGNGRVDGGTDTLVQSGVAVVSGRATFALGAFATSTTRRYLLAGDVGATTGSYSFTIDAANVTGSGARGGESPVVSGTPLVSATRTVSSNPGVPMGEVGRLGAVGETWIPVTLRNSYENPVIVAGTGSRRNLGTAPPAAVHGQPVVVRLRNVTSTGFEVSLVSDPADATAFTDESVHYLVLERGSYTLPASPADLQVEVRTIDSSKTRGAQLTPDLEETVVFAPSFPVAPVILSQIQTDNQAGYSYTRERYQPVGVSTSTFRLFIEDDEASTVQHATERLGWMAIQVPSAPTTQSGRTFEPAFTADAITQNVITHALSGSYSAPPLALATLVKIDSQENAHARVVSSTHLPTPSLGLITEEDKVFDTEITHTAEMHALTVFDGVGTIYGPLTGSLALSNPAQQPATLLQQQTDDQPILGVRLGSNAIEGAGTLRLTFAFVGTGNPSTVRAARLYLDPQGDGMLGGGETQVGVDGTFSNGQVSFDLPALARDTTQSYLLAYDIGAGVDATTYGASLDSAGVVATGALSGAAMPVSGGPVNPGPRPLVIVLDAQIAGVFGRVASVTQAWQTVTFARTVPNAVVITGPPTINAVDPVVVRVRNVTATSFEIRLQEPSNLDDVHSGEEVHYLALSSGVTTLRDGTIVQAGTVITDNTITRRYTPRRFSTVTFSQPFVGTAPVVLAQLNTTNDAKYANLRQRTITLNSFQVGIEEDEAQTTKHAQLETIGWVAIERGTGSQPVGAFEALPTPATIRQTNYVLPFVSDFLSSPTFFVGMTAVSQNDPAHMRLRTLTLDNATIFVEEDTAFDTEVSHALTTANYLALEGSGFLANNLVPPDPVTDLRATAAIGQIRLDWTNPITALQEVVIRYDTSSFPETITQGFAVEEGVFPATAGGVGSVVHDDLEAGVTYYYSVWTRSAQGLISERRTVSATPVTPAAGFAIDVDGAVAGLIAGQRYAFSVRALLESGGVSTQYARTARLTWERVLPARDAGRDLEVGTETIADNGSLLLDFAGSSGVLTFAAPAGLRYADAGQIRIRVVDTDDSDIDGEAVLGFRPFAFEVTALRTSELRAGEPFEVQVRAVIADGSAGALADNATAPNYASAPGGLRVANTYQTPPSGSRQVTPAQAGMATGDNGSTTLELAYLDAGTIAVQVEDPSYLGGQVLGVSPALAFTPHHFAVTIDTPPLNRDFFYAAGDGEPFGAGVEAQASDDSRTLNYRGTVVFTADFPALRLADPLVFGDAEAGVSKTGTAFAATQAGESIEVRASDSQDAGVTGTGRVNVRFPQAAIAVRGAKGRLPLVAVQIEILEQEATDRIVREDVTTRFDVHVAGEAGGEAEGSARITLNPDAGVAQYVRSLQNVPVASGGRITVFVYDTEVETVTLAVDRTDPVLVPTDRSGSARGDAVFGFGGIDAERIRVLERREENAGETQPDRGEPR